MPPALLRQGKHALASIRNIHPLLRHVSLTTIALVILWIYTIRHSERTTFTSKISQCDWTSWEDWPADAQPHRAVLIADPQLVDAHTYPGRPWPLSMLTEKYTDRYMARNFRLINTQLDPDSVIFLGDMLDGGREWAPERHKPLTKAQQWFMQVQSPATTKVPESYSKVEVVDTDWGRDATKRTSTSAVDAKEKRDALTTEVSNADVMKFVPGEDGRWSGYDNNYWEKEYKRFGKIFLEHKQLYPAAAREMTVIATHSQEAVNIDNGARNLTRYEYGTVMGKTRTVLSSLPGNHDLGFGSGVQLPIRARYRWHFGELNRVDVLGNHTFVSIDALSLAAWSQFEANGQESSIHVAKDRKHIYAAAQAFLDKVPTIAEAQISQTLHDLYPANKPVEQGLTHRILNITAAAKPRVQAKTDSAKALPVVLLTHVPLYREPNTDCGPKRERGHALSITGGYQYQNVLTSTLSNTIAQKLSRLGPLKHIFSGDDHDYCDVTHEYKKTGGATQVREETVKSFSWAMGVRHPGFHLVSLWNPIDEAGKPITDGPTIQSHLCLLPDQLGIFITYAWTLIITLVVLLVRSIVLSLRAPVEEEFQEQESVLQLSKLIPSSLVKLKGLAKGYKPVSKGRHRASSSALKPPSNNNLSVQRSQNARARSVSPGVGIGSPFSSPYYNPARPDQKPAPLIDQAGYYPHLRNDSPNPGSDDEESRIGDADYLDDDTQAKWRRRRRPKSKLRRVWDNFSGSTMLVGSIAGIYYILLIRRG